MKTYLVIKRTLLNSFPAGRSSPNTSISKEIAHDDKKVRLDSIADMLCTKISHDIREEFNIGPEHMEGRVQHLNHVRSVLEKVLRFEELWTLGININGKPE